jgi:hypothetical protein
VCLGFAPYLVRRAFAVKPEVKENSSTSLKEFPGFQPKEAEKISILIGGNNYPISLSELQSGQRFDFRGIRDLPISLYLDNGILCADVSLSGGAFDANRGTTKTVDIKITCFKFELTNPYYDANWTTNAFEVVRYNKYCIFQMIRKNIDTIEINGIFPVAGEGAIFVSQEGSMNLSKSDPQFQEYSLKAIFKYPSWKFLGQYADKLQN